MAAVGENRYGKEGVRLVRVHRSPYNGDTFDEWTVRVLIQGDFVSSYADGDNSKVLPTDTMKNTVYYVAQRTRATAIEDFAKELVDYLLDHHAQVSKVTVDMERKDWSHITTSNNVRHPTAFIQSSSEVQVATVERSRHGTYSIVSGLRGLTVMKTANTSFVKFYRDALTTLTDSTDRLFGTSIKAHWTYDTSSVIDFDKTRQQIRSLMIDMFAEHESESVQHTIHAIATYLFKHVPTISKVHLTMPNIHCLPVDLTRFGEPNKNEIFMPIDDPHGYIQCELTRSSMTRTLTTHILDLSCGRPAANVPVHVEQFVNGQWISISTGARTNNDGRAVDLVPNEQWQAGRWRIIFDVASYMPDGFYPCVTIEFCTKDNSHHHVPLLLNKFGYSTYRGS